MSHEHEVGGDFRDLTFTGFAGASYAFNRVASIEGRYTYQHTSRQGPEEQYRREHGVGAAAVPEVSYDPSSPKSSVSALRNSGPMSVRPSA